MFAESRFGRCLNTFPCLRCVFLILVVLTTLLPSGASMPLQESGSIRPQPGMLRYPDVSASHVVFMYANDLWLVPRVGGAATLLVNPPGQEIFPRFSPDGKTIAFVGNYDGDQDIYTIPTEGGIPERVTYHPFTQVLCDWTPAGKLIFYMTGRDGLAGQTQLFTVSPRGGLPEKLPVPYGANGAISPDGKWLAYTPLSRDGRTWKRYRGGMATDIWLFNLQSYAWRAITDWEGTDTLPMWHENRVYYLSDQGAAHRLNIWFYDTVSKERQQVTRFKEFDVKWPSIGPGPDGRGEIVFQNGSHLYLLNLESSISKSIQVQIPGDRPAVRPMAVNSGKFIQSWAISPTGKRAVVQARGDIWTLPAENGTPRNLTRTSGVAERAPAWSPDGRWIAYFSDETGEYELSLAQSDGKGERRRLTSGSGTFFDDPVWSPDSKHIVFVSWGCDFWLHTIETGNTHRIDKDPWDSRGHRFSWSHDSRWIAYDRRSEFAGDMGSIRLYNVETGERHQVTSDMYSDRTPAFDRKGEYLYFISNRSFKPTFGDLEFSFIFEDASILVAVPLRKDIKSPYLLESDEEAFGDEAKDEGKDDKKKKDKKIPERVEIDIEGFEGRAFRIPVPPGGFSGLSVNDKNQIIYTRSSSQGGGSDAGIKLFDLKDKKKTEKKVVTGGYSFELSTDGKKLLVMKGSGASIHGAAAGASGKPVVTKGMNATIDPRAEWRQVFHDVWRLFRICFYDPGMHGVDWLAMRDHYEALLDDCYTREDVSFVIAEMISELNVGHAYYSGRPSEETPRVNVGMLGVDFTLENGAFRIEKIYEAAPFELDSKSPLKEAGLEVKEGDYVLAVNGIPPDSSKDPWAAFLGTAGREITLCVSEKPVRDDSARTITVKPLSTGQARSLRYNAWIEANRSYVERETKGRVGYIYLPNFVTQGLNELVRQFYGQRGKDALIIDERWNTGGWTPDRFIELLNRPPIMYRARRAGKDNMVPGNAHAGPKCCLINRNAGSSGDLFPWMFREARLGKLIGTRTWGGVVGLSGNPGLIDGHSIRIPNVGTYELDGTWAMEGHGVDPDIEVLDNPSLMVDGADPQLDAAIKHLLDVLEQSPFIPPKRPPFPDRSGMGVLEKDK